MWVKHNKSQPTDDKHFQKWVRPCHVTHFKLLVPKICLERLKLRTSNLVYMVTMASPSRRMTNCP